MFFIVDKSTPEVLIISISVSKSTRMEALVWREINKTEISRNQRRVTFLHVL